MAMDFGMPYGFQQALDRKYAILGQEATARSHAADAEANVNNVRAGLMPAESAANIGLTGAQTGLAKANAANVDETTKFVKPLAEASVFNTRAQGSLFGQQAVGEYQLNRLSKTLAGGKSPATGMGSGMPAFGADFDAQLKTILREGMGYGN